MKNFAALPVFLDISGAINSAIGDVKSQIKSIMQVVFPFLTGILGIVFVVVLIWQGIQYRRQQDINWTLLIILLICLVICGGGAYNKTLMKHLRKYLPNHIELKTCEDYNISNNFKEVMAFALLGYCAYYKIPNNLPCCTGASRRVVMGKVTW